VGRQEALVEGDRTTSVHRFRQAVFLELRWRFGVAAYREYGSMEGRILRSIGRYNLAGNWLTLRAVVGP